MLTDEAIPGYLDWNKPFNLFTDLSDFQLGATLLQDGRQLGYYTHKLNSSQQNYTVGEK